MDGFISELSKEIISIVSSMLIWLFFWKQVGLYILCELAFVWVDYHYKQLFISDDLQIHTTREPS